MLSKYPTLVVVALFFSFLIPDKALSQIISDETLDQERSIINPLSPDYNRIDGGAIRGSHLFHSFREFNIPDGHAAYFSNPEFIQTIFSRVTGNTPSQIMGTLGVLGNANLVFINPHGVIFGQNANLDISGSFIVTTAESIHFPDGNQFSAVNPQGVPLLTINIPIPVGIVFEGDSTGKIYNAGDLKVGRNLSFIGGEIINLGSLTALQGDIELNTKDLYNSELVSGNIIIQSSSDQISILSKNANLNAGNNLMIAESKIGTQEDLRLTAEKQVLIRDSALNSVQIVAANDLIIQGNQEIDIFALNHPHSGLLSGKDMILKSSEEVGGDAHFSSGGNFRIEKLNGELGSLNSPNDPIIRSQGDVEFFAYQGTSLHILSGGSVNIDTIIITGVDDSNNSINSIKTPDLAKVTLSNGQEITVNGNQYPTLDIRAGMNLDKIGIPLGTIRNTETFFNESINLISPPSNNPISPTNANITIGDIWINANNGRVLLTNQYEPNLSLDQGNILLKSDGFFGDGIYTNRSTGNAGSVILDARGTITLNNEINTTSRLGNSGDVTLLANNEIQINSNINTFTSGFNTGNSGTVIIKSDENVILNSNISTNRGRFSIGKGGDVMIEGDQVTLNNGSFIFTGNVSDTNFGVGNAGNVTVIANNLELNKGSYISTTSNDQGNSGNIHINSRNQVKLDNSSVLDTSLVSRGEGNAGEITITTGRLEVTNNSYLDAGSSGLGNGGNINIMATDAVIFKEGLFTSASSNIIGLNNRNDIIRNSGNLTIITGSLEVSNGAVLETFNTAKGNSGNIIINASKNVTFSGNLSGIFTNIGSSITSGKGNSGNIQINADSLTINDQAEFNNSVTGMGNTGNIILNLKDYLSLNQGKLSTNLNKNSLGNIGQIHINTNHLSLNNHSGVNTRLEGQSLNNHQERGIIITANSVEILNQSFLNSSVTGKGKGGDIALNILGNFYLQDSYVTSSLLGEGKGGNITINFQEVTRLNHSFIANTIGENALGEGGEIQVNTNSLILENNSLISTSTSGKGNAGDIILKGNDILFQDTSGVSSGVRLTGIGEGGNIQITGNNLTLLNNSLINTDTFGQGNTGKIKLDIQNTISLDNKGSIFATVNDASSGISQGININTNELIVRDQSIISTATETSANAGDIIIMAKDKILLDQNSVISSDVFQSTGKGGIINLTSPNISLLNHSSIQSITSGQGEGGTIIIQGDSLSINNNSGLLTNTINKGNAGNISLNLSQGVNLDYSDITASVSIDTINNIIPTGDGGKIIIQTPTLNLMNNSSLLSTTEGKGNAGEINLLSNQILTLDNSNISTEIATSGIAENPSNITLNTQFLTLKNNSQITTSTEGIGDAGSIIIPNGQTINLNQSQINASTNGKGKTGEINLTATNQIQLNQSEINSKVEQNGVGNTQKITLNTPNLSLTNSTLSAETLGQGNAGEINLLNNQILNLNNSNISTKIAASGIAENPSNITLNTQFFTLKNNSQITTATEGIGDAGSIIIPNGQIISLKQSQMNASTNGRSNAGNINLNAKDTINLINSNISSRAEINATGDGGEITLNTSNLTLNNSQITTSSQGKDNADAGNVNINSNQIVINNNSRISATTSGGEGGNISLISNTLDIFNESQIKTTTEGNNNAGDINLMITDSLIVTGNNSGILADATVNAWGNSGNIFIDPPILNITEGGFISVNNQGQGLGGNIEIFAGNLLLDKGKITATTATNTGGNINLIIEDTLHLKNGSEISTTAGTFQTGGDGGNIRIIAKSVLSNLYNSNRITANAFTGKGGNINITANNLLGFIIGQGRDNISYIDASSQFGIDGIIVINVTNIDPTRSLENLPQTNINTEIKQGCQGNNLTNTAEFYQIGKGGILVNPTQLFNAFPLSDTSLIPLENDSISPNVIPFDLHSKPLLNFVFSSCHKLSI